MEPPVEPWTQESTRATRTRLLGLPVVALFTPSDAGAGGRLGVARAGEVVVPLSALSLMGLSVFVYPH